MALTTSPGAAASEGFEGYLAKREAAALLLRKQQIEEAKLQNEIEEKRAELALKLRHADLQERTAQQQIHDKQRQETQKEIEDTVPGDIIGPDLLQRAKERGVSIRLNPPAPIAGTALEPSGVEKAMAGSQGLPSPTFAGSPKQRQDEIRKAKIQDIAQRLQEVDPSSPEGKRLALEYTFLMEKVPTAEELKSSTQTQEVYRQNPRTGAIERVGAVPKGAHFMTQPDTSAADANRAQREEKRLDTLRQQAYTEIEKAATRYTSSIEDFDRLGTALNQRTAQADADVAIILLKAYAGGYGSGLRMTQAEINNTLHGRTRWEDIEAAAKRLSLKPQDTTIPATQRQAIRELGSVVRKKAYAIRQGLMNARSRIAESDDPRDINRLRNNAIEQLTPAESTLDTPGGTPGKLPDVGDVFNGGKVLRRYQVE